MFDDKIQTKIVLAAEDLFKEKEYEDITIRDICHHAGVSIGAFYHHIGSKEKLFEIFQFKIGTDSLEPLLEKIDGKNSIEKIFIIIDLYMDYASKFGYKFCRYFLSLSLQNHTFANPPGSLNIFLNDYIHESLNNGSFDAKYNADYIYRCIYSSLRGATFNWTLEEGKSDLKKDFEITLNILIDAFKSK